MVRVSSLLRNLSFVVALLAMITFLVGTAAAQDAVGRIVGTITDPTGSPILGADVTVLNVATQVSQHASTSEYGYFQVLSLPIGTYTITIEHSGFRKQVYEKQVLQIDQSLKFDTKLEIGQQSEVVEVKDQIANVETTDQTLGANVVGETIQRAPLNGRNVLDLAKLQPGVTETNGDSTAAGTYSIGGGRSDSVTYLLDGGLNNNLLDNSVVFQSQSGHHRGISHSGEQLLRGVRPQRRRSYQRGDQVGHQPVPRERLRIPAQRCAQRQPIFQ